MRIRAFTCGTLRSFRHLFTAGKGVGIPFEVPVPFYLIEHGRARVLFDTGNALAVARDKVGHWGAEAVAAYDPCMREEDHVEAQLRRIGIDPGAITHVVLSHLHLDHAGGLGSFPHAVHVCQRAELHHAYVPEPFQRKAYIRADFDRSDIDWLLLDGERDDGFDVLGDGTLTILPTPGHTPGHQSLIVRPPGRRPWLLAGDSVYLEELLDGETMPGLLHSPAEAVRTIRRIRHLRDAHGLRIITGHDPLGFPPTLDAAPEPPAP